MCSGMGLGWAERCAAGARALCLCCFMSDACSSDWRARLINCSAGGLVGAKACSTPWPCYPPGRSRSCWVQSMAAHVQRRLQKPRPWPSFAARTGLRQCSPNPTDHHLTQVDEMIPHLSHQIAPALILTDVDSCQPQLRALIQRKHCKHTPHPPRSIALQTPSFRLSFCLHA
ncbi:hypothetical protein BKA81DRAFT_224803 [Phyllosticta paracitricarpa]|uniref:Secreted protein n=1 Tax=Phyllosticta paracitricarpa TaxID=2016321 RepID=A0ABR1N7C6_9PEZI